MTRPCYSSTDSFINRWTRTGVILGFVVIVIVGGRFAKAEKMAPIEFNRDIRPILSDRCFACHGPDAGSREADLRLDLREEATADHGGVRVITPGKPDQSEIIARIESEDEDECMPPRDAGKPLTGHDRQVLRRWILEGAVWQQHWSRIPPRRPNVPDIRNPTRAANPIDRFILTRLDRRQVQPVPEADRRTLIRRLSLDLTGLPPKPEDVAAFVNDNSAHAYEKQVDCMLNSPHYGERMAIYWLDLVRYADTLGYHGDQPRSVSPYRDYVITAFNDNMPFDQFTIENLAGDLLPNATLTQKVASTYNRLNRASAEGGVQPKEYLAKYAADRVRTTGSVWLGSTLGCAECHDHKFDPFTTKDFYSFAAFFADVKEQGIVPGAVHIEQLPVPTAEQQAALTDLDTRITTAKAKLNQKTPQCERQFSAWQREVMATPRRWVPLVPNKAVSTAGASLVIQPDGAILATGKSPATDTYVVTIPTTLNKLTAIRLETLPDKSLPQQGPGRAGNGNFVIQSFTVSVGNKRVPWKAAAASHSQNDFGIEHLLNQKDRKGWAILPQTGKTLQAVFAVEGSIRLAAEHGDNKEEGRLTVVITQDHGARHTLGHFRLYASSAENIRPTSEIQIDQFLSGPIGAILAVEPKQRSAQQRHQLWELFRDTSDALKPQRAELTRLKTDRDRVKKSIITTLATKAGTPRLVRVLPRGNWMDDSGEVVQPAVPRFLQAPTTSERRLSRLDLARWLVEPDNPLTARTFVNRLWMLLFGQGIAPSVDDLGSQGQWPTHLALLDWLAVEFVESGWDVKHMVKLMVMSNAYRRSSMPNGDLRNRDPFNRLLARQGRWRIDAEMVRDNALLVSGLLVSKIGGPSVKPYQPAGYWSQLNFPKRVYKADTGDSQYRRGLYTHWQRTYLHPSLLAFDAPVREECVPRRDRSNTPLQSLVLLNDPTYVEAARVLAGRIIREGGPDVPSRLKWTYNRVLARAPSPKEVGVMTSFYKRNERVFQGHPEEAEKLIHVGLAPVDSELDPMELAAWACVARAMLNLHETITRY